MKKNLTSVITGDIINSSKSASTAKWISALTKTLNKGGTEHKDWEIYRGDSFQLEVKNIEDAFLTCIRIKAIIKQFEDLDVRMAIGIGEKTYESPKITQSNGSAFINSGKAFEKLKKETLMLKSPWAEFDRQMNLLFSLISQIMDQWTAHSAEIVMLSLEMPEATQQEIAAKLKITQGRVSERLKRAAWDQVVNVDQRFRELIKSNKQAGNGTFS
ncbi:MAG: SatD family protein [Imperialibacter sp.]|uniref:SatD family protein n=1 Tax=Imperialibacter sp. TaxID=2038411 RepID=UPI0032EEEFA2